MALHPYHRVTLVCCCRMTSETIPRTVHTHAGQQLNTPWESWVTLTPYSSTTCAACTPGALTNLKSLNPKSISSCSSFCWMGLAPGVTVLGAAANALCAGAQGALAVPGTQGSCSACT